MNEVRMAEAKALLDWFRENPDQWMAKSWLVKPPKSNQEAWEWREAHNEEWNWMVSRINALSQTFCAHVQDALE